MRPFALSFRTQSGRALAASLNSLGFACASTHTAFERGITEGIPYAIGGSNTDARRELSAMSSAYSVMLLFAHGLPDEYASDVKVRVRDRAGQPIVALDDSGPIVLLGLEPGSYEVEVEHGGKRQSRPVEVGERTRRQMVFYWRETHGT